VDNYGWLSIVPALLAIGLAIVTRQVIMSLFLAVVVGATFLHGYNPGAGLLRTFDTYILDKVADPWYAAILIFTMMIAAMIGLVTRSGGASAIAEALAKRAKTPRGAQLAAWLMGMVIFFDDYGSCLITGNTARPLTDRLRVSREKLSYIVDSTAAPVATMAIISTWIGFELGVIGEGYEAIGQQVSPFLIFLQTLPYRFYSIFALIMVGAIAFMLRDFGPMHAAERRARTTGKVMREGAVPLAAADTAELLPAEGTRSHWVNFVVPVVTTIVATFVGLYIHGGGAEAGSIREAIGAADSSVVLLWSSAIGVVVALLLVVLQKVLSLAEALDTVVKGAKSVFLALMILVLAWGLASVSEGLGTGKFLVGVVEAAQVPAAIIPVLIFIVACFISFAMGTSWGTMGILTPLAIPIAYAVGAPLIPSVGAVLTGAIFGDHCSPISDTTILSSTGCSADHIDHVRTQMPYALVAGGIAAVVGFIPAGFGLHPILSIAVGLAAVIAAVRFFGKSTEADA
jgi:Na+/H+ antiporter NhaC